MRKISFQSRSFGSLPPAANPRRGGVSHWYVLPQVRWKGNGLDQGSRDRACLTLAILSVWYLLFQSTSILPPSSTSSHHLLPLSVLPGNCGPAHRAHGPTLMPHSFRLQQLYLMCHPDPYPNYPHTLKPSSFLSAFPFLHIWMKSFLSPFWRTPSSPSMDSTKFRSGCAKTLSSILNITIYI